MDRAFVLADYPYSRFARSSKPRGGFESRALLFAGLRVTRSDSTTMGATKAAFFAAVQREGGEGEGRERPR